MREYGVWDIQASADPPWPRNYTATTRYLLHDQQLL